MKQFAKSLTNAQMAEAREFEKYHLCSISQAVKSFERQDIARLRDLRERLRGAKEIVEEHAANE